jgi:pimeloyl-ACP methyl ester carboxylesterase
MVLGKKLRYAAIATAGLVVVVLSSALLYRKYLQHKVAEARVIHSSNGINRLEPLQVGGIVQWVEVRGENIDNPILLFIHGGPGVAFIPLSASFQGPWEKHFVVVQWDQRGAGKTYASNDRELQRKTMNVPQMEQDAVDVANYLRHRFRRQRIFVVGHSWGSLLGLWLAHEHPELMYAYVGVAQVISVKQNEEVAYQDALHQARVRNNQPALTALESIAPYPPPEVDPRKAQTAQGWQTELLGPPASGPRFMDIRRLLLDLVSAPQYSLTDVVGFVGGQMLSLEVLVPEVARLDLSRLGPDFHVPVFFFEGTHDPYNRPLLVQEYSRAVNAPHKELIWFDNSGHFPFFEEKQRFTEELVRRVLPLAADR